MKKVFLKNLSLLHKNFFRALKSRLEDDIILSSINGFIAELKKITIDLLHGELALPMSAMYKEHKLLPNENIAAFMAKRFNVPDEDFFKARLVKFHIDTGMMICLIHIICGYIDPSLFQEK